MSAEIFLDNNATTKTLPEVREAMMEVLGDGFGNPSSAHGAGDRGRAGLRRARIAVAGLVGACEDEVLFTSSGTEANNLVLLSVLEHGPGRLVITEVEHSSVLKAGEYLEARGVEVVRLPVGSSGRIAPESVAQAISPATSLVSIQWVNNETGVIQPMERIAQLCEERGVPLHSDAAQALGKLPLDLSSVPVAFLTLTAHKLHGPAGVGALVIRRPGWLRPMIHGGPQEQGLRSGTENLAGIVGFGVASQLRHQRLPQVLPYLERLRDHFEQNLLADPGDIEVNGDTKHRIGNTSNLLFRGVDGQALVARLDRRGIRCSQSSACTNQRPEPSYVLEAMGLSEDEAYASVRFSVSEQTTVVELDQAAEIVAGEVKELRRLLTPRRYAEEANARPQQAGVGQGGVR